MHKFIPITMRTRQQGLSSLEFAIVGLATLLILLTAIEMGRLMYTANLLAEMSRRTARVAVICQANDAYIKQAGVLNDGGGSTSPYLRNLTIANISVEYLDASGAPAADPTENVFFVRASITGYTFVPLIPVDSFAMPEFSTTLPSESMGFVDDDQNSTCNSGVGA